jgi:hypothetical protein
MQQFGNSISLRKSAQRTLLLQYFFEVCFDAPLVPLKLIKVNSKQGSHRGHDVFNFLFAKLN